jgi:hypothetical protein
LDWATSQKHTETYNAIVASQQQVITVKTSDGLKTMIDNNDLEALKAYLDEHPEALSSIKNANVRLRFTGPAELRIIDIAQMVKEGNKDALIIAQINSVGGPYKKFSASEISALKKMKISDELVVAMIAVTTEYSNSAIRQVRHRQNKCSKPCSSQSNRCNTFNNSRHLNQTLWLIV